jgi:Uncharacterized protein conserved in bacteria
MKQLLISTCLIAMASAAVADNHAITKEEVIAAQKQWGEGIEAISDVYQEKGDYREKAAEHIRTLYAYEQGTVLFKPTLASEDQFRETFDEALSYFVGGIVEEDQGFAIRPWSKVRFGKQEIITDSDSATAMGNYYFTPVGEDEEVKAEYTFGYMKDENGNVRINVHHSSLPFSPEE